MSDSPDGELPPRREQLPLPRRAGQSHLEPQLREPGGAGSGTPFEAFDAPGPGRSGPDKSGPDKSGTDRSGTGASETDTHGAPDAGTATPPSGERVARFRDAVRRATDDSRRTG